MSRYTKEFKEEAIRLVITNPRSIVKTVRDLGVYDNRFKSSKKRRHSTLGYLSPAEFERRYQLQLCS